MLYSQQDLDDKLFRKKGGAIDFTFINDKQFVYIPHSIIRFIEQQIPYILLKRS